MPATQNAYRLAGLHLPVPAFFKLTTVYGDAKNCGLSVAAKDTPDASSEFL